MRNADIELRNGETDIGRKNTRVRLVFRVHIPQPGGQLVSLQAASQPIECCKEGFIPHKIHFASYRLAMTSNIAIFICTTILMPYQITSNIPSIVFYENALPGYGSQYCNFEM